MPRIVYPPTPGSSTDITGEDGTKQLDRLQMTFSLPEPAMTMQDAGQKQQTTPTEEMSPSYSKPASYTQPSETVKSRRRSSAVQQQQQQQHPSQVKDQFALPPPPTRSRKIIQMKPRAQTGAGTTNSGSATATTKSSKGTATATAAAASDTAAGNKRKQQSTTSAAGRKMARKTAHSLIERRRRSKMNDEFALLKSLIPACSGEMHKLAILQASVEYIRYLEDCVGKLKAQRTSETAAYNDSSRYIDEPFHPIDHTGDRDDDDEEEEEEEGEDELASPDIEMEGSDIPSPALTATHPRSQQPSVSPVLLAQRHNSQSSASTTATGDYRYYEYATSASTSPAFGPQAYHYPHSAAGSVLTSPALGPQQDGDREATAALLMLNRSDRRGTGSSAGRGMSVKDLLSS